MCKKLMFLISFVSVLVLAGSVFAGDDYMWDGNSPYSSLWVDPLNWEPLGGPGPDDTAELEPGFSGVEPVVLVDNSVDGIKGPRRDENGDMTLEIVSGWLQIGDKWELVDGSDSGTSIINIGLGIGFGDPCVTIGGGFEAFTDEDAGGEVYLNIGGNSYVLCDGDFKVFTDDKEMPGYFEMNIGDTATVDVKEMRFGDDTTLSESQLTVSGSATLNVFDGELRHSDSDVMRILITDNAYVYINDTFRGADGDNGSDETHITGNAHVVANHGWESQDGTTLWTVDGNALVEVYDNDMYYRNGVLNIGGTATVLVEKDLQLNEKTMVFNMYDCGPHVVCEGLGLPSDNDSDFATFNLHGGLIEIGENGLYHDNDDWLLDICECGVMVIDGDVVDEIWEGVDDGKITICGYYQGCGSQADLMVDYDDGEDKTTVWVEVDPNRAYNPDPICCTDPEAEPVPQEVCLSWDAGATAEEHFVFLHTNIDKLTTPGDMSALVAITEETEYCTEPLILGATYYWRVDEVWDCGTATGQLWCFVVTSCVSFDDMESYDNADPENYIWATWVEGAGDVHGQGGNGTGSCMYTATDPVHTGEKSMEYFYNSTGWEREYAYSEVQKPLDPAENFADNGEKVLRLWFYGDPTNITESMWVALTDGSANTEISTYGILVDSPDDIKNAEWKDWIIDLQDFADGGVNLEDIVEISIGFGERGRDGEHPGDPIGVVNFDDIALCTTICVPRYAPDGDINDDCVVDWEDVEEMVEDWLEDLR